MKAEELNKTMDKVKKILDDAGVEQYVLALSGYKDHAEIVERAGRDPGDVVSATKIEADEKTLLVMIVTMLEWLIKKTAKPEAYTRKINHVVANIKLVLHIMFLN